MILLEPQGREADAWKRWARYALSLQSQHKFISIILCFFVIGLSTLIFWSGYRLLNLLLMLFLAPVMLSIFTVIAFWFDRSSIPDWSPQRLPRLLGRVLLLGLLGWLVLATLIILLLSIGYFIYLVMPPEVVVTNPLAVPSSDGVVSGQSKFYLFFSVLVLTLLPLAAFFSQGLIPFVSIWFVLPVILYVNIGIFEAYRLSYRAERKNWPAVNMSILLCLSLLGLVLVSGGILVLLILPFMGAFQYASFRDVFLQQLELTPKKTKSIAKVVDSTV